MPSKGKIEPNYKTLMDGVEDVLILSDREKNSMGRHAMDLFKVHLRIKIPEDGKYSIEDVILPVLGISISNTYLETIYDQENVVHVIFGNRIDMPSPETVMRSIKRHEVTGLHSDARVIIKEVIEEIKKAKLIDVSDENEIVVAIDFHNKKRYRKLRKGVKKRKKSEDMRYAIGIKPKDGARYAHKYATIQIVGTKGCNVVLDFVPITPLSSKVEVMRELINNAESVLGRKVNLILGDGDFDDIDAIRSFQELDEDYICHMGKSNTVKEHISSMGSSVVKFVEDFKIGKGKRFATTNLLIVDTDWLKEWDINIRELPFKDRYYTFVTSLKPSRDETIYEFALKVVKTYKKRWGIETGYRDIDFFMAMTHALSYRYRFLLFAIAVILYNLWRLWAHRLKDKIKIPITKDVMKAIFTYLTQAIYGQDRPLFQTFSTSTTFTITFTVNS